MPRTHRGRQRRIAEDRAGRAEKAGQSERDPELFKPSNPYRPPVVRKSRQDAEWTKNGGLFVRKTDAVRRRPLLPMPAGVDFTEISDFLFKKSRDKGLLLPPESMDSIDNDPKLAQSNPRFKIDRVRIEEGYMGIDSHVIVGEPNEATLEILAPQHIRVAESLGHSALRPEDIGASDIILGATRNGADAAAIEKGFNGMNAQSRHVNLGGIEPHWEFEP